MSDAEAVDHAAEHYAMTGSDSCWCFPTDLLNIAEDVVTLHARTVCTDLDTCACSMAALHREVRHLRDTETKETR